ncbi:MAG: TIGR03032 family protein [Rhodospirillales bacterium]
MTGETGERAATPEVVLTASRQFTAWLAERRLSLAFTTYQAGKLFLIGLQPDGRLSIFERTFARCMGLCAAGDSLWMSSLYQLWRFENALPPGRVHDGSDRLYVPRVAYTTGDLDIHDVAVDGDGRPLFVNTLFSCVATVSERASFRPLWTPSFVSKLAAEDRCHLNGLAVEDGALRYVTAVSRSDVADGWRDRRDDGGVVVDVASGEILAHGLSMPHSPRVHDGRLWLLESGTGHLGAVDRRSGRFEATTFCPGYLRGLAFAGDFAVVGLSKCRDNRTFSGLRLDANLAARDAEPRCGLMVIDIRSGDIVHWLRIEGIVAELYDVAVLPGVVRPTALGFKTDEIRRTLTIDEPAGAAAQG